MDSNQTLQEIKEFLRNDKEGFQNDKFTSTHLFMNIFLDINWMDKVEIITFLIARQRRSKRSTSNTRTGCST